MNKILFLLLFSLGGYATTPKEILDKHMMAVGDKDRLESLESAERAGTIYFPDHGQPAPKGSGSYRTRIIYPDRVRIEIKVGAYQLDQIKNKEKYWSLEGQSYEEIKDASLREELTNTSLRANREILWWSQEHKNIRLSSKPPKGIDQVNCIEGEKAEKTEFACFDRSTGLLKAYGTGQEFRVYSDWKLINDLKFPFVIKQYKKGLLSYSIELSSFKINSSLKDSDFSPTR